MTDTLHALALLLAALFLATRATLMGLPEFGWIARPWYVRLAMSVFATTLMVRAWVVYSGAPAALHLTQNLTAASLLAWQFIELAFQVGRSRRLEAMKRMTNGEHKVAAVYELIGTPKP